MTRSAKNLCLLIVLVCATHAVAQTSQVRLKLADGSYMTVDDAWESAQGIWYRQGGLSHLLAKEKVKKIERTEPTTSTPPAATANDDDHFEVPEVDRKSTRLTSSHV